MIVESVIDKKNLGFKEGINKISTIASTLLNEELISRGTFDNINNMLKQITIQVPSPDEYFDELLESFGPEIFESPASSSNLGRIRLKDFTYKEKQYTFILKEKFQKVTNNVS